MVEKVTHFLRLIPPGHVQPGMSAIVVVATTDVGGKVKL